MNQGTKLYVIMQFILKSQKSFNPAFKVSRPTWSRDHFFGLGLGLGLTVIGLGLGLGIMR